MAMGFNDLHAETTSLQKNNLVCGSIGYWEADGFYVQANVRGQIEKKQQGDKTVYSLNNYSGNFTITYPEDVNRAYSYQNDKLFIWAQGYQNGETIDNDPSYRPRKYKDHLRYDLGLDNIGSTQFLLPVKKIEEGEPLFRTVMIMSWIQDHFGTTLPMVCQLY